MRIFLVMVFALMASSCVQPSYAEGPDGMGIPSAVHHHDPNHADFYSKWQRNGGMGSCCNERIMEDGKEVGDCSPTKAETRRGKDGIVRWWARLPHDGPMVEVPDSVIIRAVNPDPTGQDAHLCWNNDTFYCFVPPTGGS